MAMRPRAVGVRPLAVSRPVYEDFTPLSEWKQQEDADLLLIYLPGFLKEYLRVTTENRNTIRVQGERQVAGNKWSRFQEDFQVPENCNMRGIRAKFEGGILTITMPRKSTVTQSPQGSYTTPKAPPPSPRETSARSQKSSTDKEDISPIPKKVASDQKSQKGVDEIPPRATTSTGTEKQPNRESMQSTSAENVQQRKESSETKGKPGESEKSQKATEKAAVEERKSVMEKGKELIDQAAGWKESISTKVKPRESEMSQKATEKAAVEERKSVMEKGKELIDQAAGWKESTSTKGKPRESEMSQKTTEKAAVEQRKSVMEKGKELIDQGVEWKESILTKGKPRHSEMSQKAIEKTAVEEEQKRREKGKEPIDQAAKVVEKMTEKGDGSSSGPREEKTVVNEERQLMVNMGVAVLVIVALGAYVYYTFRSSGNAKH